LAVPLGAEPVSSALAGDDASEGVPMGEAFWADAARVPLGGGGLLDCHGQRAGDWLRVVCAGDDNLFSRAPTGAVVDPALERQGAARAHIDGTRAVLVARWAPGRRLSATVIFEDAAVPLEGAWPRGAPEPAPPATFRGVPAIERALLARYLCRCRSFAEDWPSCDAATLRQGGGTVLECLRAHPPTGSEEGDREACQHLTVCVGADPFGEAECLPGETHVDACVSCRCAIECGAAACPPGMRCVEHRSPLRGDARVCEIDARAP
jgi:hypothetical protein